MERIFLFTPVLAIACIFCSCEKEDSTPPTPPYDGTTLTTVLASKCSGDVYGLGTNVIDLRLATGNITYDSSTETFTGEGSCIVLSLMDDLTEELLPTGGSYTPADWEKMQVNKTFDPGVCEYNTDFNCWLAAGTYIVSIDKDGKTDYTAFTDGYVSIEPKGNTYVIECQLKDQAGKETKARYEGAIDFTTPSNEKYLYENTTPGTVSPTISSADIRYWGKDDNGLGLYKLSLWGENEKITMLELRHGTPDSNKMPDGTYSITTDTQTEGILAGYYSGGELIGAYTAQFDSSYGQILNVWYLTDGSLIIKNNADGTITITLNATSAYGSTVNMAYTGEFSYIALN